MLYVVCLSKQLTSKKKKPASSVNPPPLDPAPHDSAPHDDISSGSDTENNNSDSSEIEAEPEWADNPQEVQPVIQVTSKRSALVQNEVRAMAPFRNSD